MADAKIRIKGEDDTAAAFRSAGNNLKNFKGSADSLATSLGTLLGAGGVLSVVSLGNFVKSAIDGIDALNDLKDATGASIENLSALEDVAARTGTSFGTVESALVKFNAVLNKAEPDSSASQALKAIGLEAEALKRLDPAEALRQTAAALSTFADDGNKARIVQELFGKSVKEVAPFLKDLAEKGELLATVTTKQAEEAEKFNKELFNMQKNTADLARYLASDLVTAMNTTIEKFRQGKKEGKDFFENYADWVRNFYNMKPAQIGGATGSWATGDAGRGGVNPDFVKPSLPSSLNTSEKGKTRSSAGSDPYAESQRYLENLQRQLEKKQDLTVAEQALADIEAGRLGKVTPKLQAAILSAAKNVDLEKESIAALKGKRDAAIEAGDAINKGNEEYQSTLARLLSATPTANLEKQRSDMQLLTAEFEAGRLSETLYTEAVSARLDLTADKTLKAKTAAEELGLTFVSAFEDAITSGKDLSTLLDGLMKDITKMAIRKAVTEPMANLVTSGFRTFLAAETGGLSNFLSFDGGGYTGSGARSGGIDGKGGFMAVMHPQETVTDHTKGQSTASVVNNYNFTVGDVASKTMVMQAIGNAQRQSAAVVRRSNSYS